MNTYRLKDSVLVLYTMILAFGAFGCARLHETTRIQAAGEKTTTEVFHPEPLRTEVEVLRIRSMRVIEGRFRACTRTFLQTTQPQVQVIERTTSPSAGMLAGAGLGALGVGAAVALFGQCEANDSKCNSGRGVAAVAGAGAFVGLEISALVNGIRSIDKEKEAPPEVATAPTNAVHCTTKPIQSEDVWATIRERRVTLGTLSSNGRLVLTPALASDLAFLQGRVTVGVGEATTVLDLKSEHDTQCGTVTQRLFTSSDIPAMQEALQNCTDTDSAAILRTRISDVYRDQRAATLPATLPHGSTSNASTSKSKVGMFIGCLKDVALDNLCDSVATSLFHITAPAGVATTGSVCNALTQAFTSGKLDGWQIAIAGGKALLLALIGEVGEIVGAAGVVLDFGQCLAEEGFFR